MPHFERAIKISIKCVNWIIIVCGQTTRIIYTPLRLNLNERSLGREKPLPTSSIWESFIIILTPASLRRLLFRLYSMKINERQRTYKNKDQKVLVYFIMQISLLFWYLQNQPLHLLSTYFLFIALHIWENLDHNFVICSPEYQRL